MQGTPAPRTAQQNGDTSRHPPGKDVTTPPPCRAAAPDPASHGPGIQGTRRPGRLLPRAPRTRPAVRQHHAQGHPDPRARKGHTPPAHPPRSGPLARTGTVRAPRQRLAPLAWVGAVLTVPLPLPDLTHSSSARGQEAPAPQDSTHPGKEQRSRSRSWGNPEPRHQRAPRPRGPEVQGSRTPLLAPAHEDQKQRW